MKTSIGALTGCVNNWKYHELLITKWLHREIPEHELKNIELAELIKEYDERFDHILGYRRMTSLDLIYLIINQ